MKNFHKIKNFEKFMTTITITALILILFIFCITALLRSIHKSTQVDSRIYQSSSEVLDFSESNNTILVVDLNSEAEPNIDTDKNEEKDSISDAKNDNTKKENNISTSDYYIKVNYQANVVNIYKKDSNGELQPYKVMTCSTGTATPKSGTYSIQTKWVWGTLFGHTPGTYLYGQYVTKIVGNILFHSVPYTAQNKASLEYDQYDRLGTTASAGCVRLTVIDSKWIFDNMPYGTPVEFYADSNPGPMGKPATQKISNNIECRNWDPTDPDANNPWIEYNKNLRNSEEQAKKEEQQQIDTFQSENVEENSSTQNNNSIYNEIEESKNENTNNVTNSTENNNNNNIIANDVNTTENTNKTNNEDQGTVEIKNTFEINNDLII